MGQAGRVITLSYAAPGCVSGWRGGVALSYLGERRYKLGTTARSDTCVAYQEARNVWNPFSQYE